MSAKSELFNHLKYLDSALQSESIIDKDISESNHNGAANLIRKGLGIVSFNILEDFIKSNIFEVLDSISKSGVSYDNLPAKLQEATTLGALKALVFRAKIDKKDGKDWVRLIHSETKNIHSTSLMPFSLSKYSFVSENSNISSSEITDMLKALGISGGWDTLKNISNNISGGVADLNQSYHNASLRRHNAAHFSSFQYEYSWLYNIRAEILAIAASLNILLTALCRLINRKPDLKLEQHDAVSSIKYRFLCFEDSIYKEKLDPNGKSIKNWTILDDAIGHIKHKLLSKNEFLIILDNSKRIINWYC